MNLLAMNKRLSILPGSQNHKNYELLRFPVTKQIEQNEKSKKNPKVQKNEKHLKSN